MVCTRSSSNAAARKSSSEVQKMAPTKMKTYPKRKNQKKPSEKHQQLQLQQEKEQEKQGHLVTPPPPPPPPPPPHTEEEQQQEEENHLATPPPPPPPPGGPGHENEAEIEVVGGGEVMFLDVSSSSEEETKPQVDHLSRLRSVSKPPYRIKIPPKNLKKLMDAAVVLKDDLVSHLEKTAHKLDVADMVRSANDCIDGLRALKVDHGAFHGEVHKLIKYFQELKETKGKNTCTDLGLEVAYGKILAEADNARDELINAQFKLINAQTNYNLRMENIEKLIAMLGSLKEEAAMEKDELGNLEDKRDHCNEALSLAETNKERYEEIQMSLSRLRDLV